MQPKLHRIFIWIARIPLRSHGECRSTLGVCGFHGLVRDGAAWITTTSTRANVCTVSHFVILVLAFLLLRSVRPLPARHCRRAATDNRLALRSGRLYGSPRLHRQPLIPVVSRVPFTNFTWPG